MKKIRLSAIALALQLSAFTQDKVELLRVNTFPITSVNVKDTSSNDMEAMAKAIGESRIVMLGGMDAGDAETIRAKSRIISFLHQKMGFSVLAFQTDFYSANMLWDVTRSTDSLLPLLDKWQDAAEFQGMKEYMSKATGTANPLIVTGYDPNPRLDMSGSTLRTQVKSLFKALGYDAENLHYNTYLETMLMATDLETMRKMDDTTFNYLKNITRGIIADLAAKPHADRTGFFRQTLQSLLGQAYWCHQNRHANPNALDASVQYKQMAVNLLWLAEKKYAGRKIIIWGNNQMVSKNYNRLEVRHSNFKMPLETTMGSELAKVFEEELFTIGFSSHEGTTPALITKDDTLNILQTGRNDWYTNVLGQSPFRYAFSDFRKIREHEEVDASFTMRGWGYNYEIRGEWFQVFDGMFFIRSNQPVTSLTSTSLKTTDISSEFLSASSTAGIACSTTGR